VSAIRVVWPAVGRAEIESFDPHPPGPGEVQAAAWFTLISPGTERGWLSGEIGFPTAPGFAGGFPFRPGYSFAGSVVACGRGVEGFRPGDAVITAGFGTGCHSEVVTLPAEVFTPVPEGVPLERAAWFGLGDVAVFGARRARIEVGESVAVLGQGPIGLLTTQVARLSGALPVVALDPAANRRELAAALGADVVLDPAGAAAWFDSFDVVLELTARREPLDLAMQLVARAGRIVMVTAQSEPYTTDLHAGLFMKGASLTGVFTGARPQHDSRPGSWTVARDVDTFLRLLAAGRIDVDSLVTHRLNAEDAPAAYDMLLAGDPAMVGALLRWPAARG
jgi:2-desacetyl-2-hydroxyethyl bacteriochlorophyllide A dehydrogenase